MGRKIQMDVRSDENPEIPLNPSQPLSELPESRTDWSSVRLIAAITFFDMILISVMGISIWPYMKQVDPLATSTFFGYIGSVNYLGHAICTPLLGYWSSATGQAKLPLIVGRLIAMVGCMLYMCLEFFPHGRRYVMLACYTIFGISRGSASVMRSCVAKISTVKDRAMVVSMCGLAVMLAIAAGPAVQLSFTSLSYPGYNIIGKKIFLNTYTGPIYVSACAAIFSLILIVFFFEDKLSICQQSPRNIQGRKATRAIDALTTDLRAFDVSLALSCIFVGMIAALTNITQEVTTAPLMMSAFGWSNIKTVKIISYMQSAIGVICIIIFAGFASGKLTKIISERCGALIGMLLFGLFFTLTYPWSFLGGTIPVADAAQNRTGCDAVAYKWCLTSYAVSPAVYISSMVAIFGVALTIFSISVDTLYSKILGNIDQGTMQGVYLVGLDIVSVCGPLIIAPSFTHSGQKYIWMVAGIIIALGCFRWITIYKRLPKSDTFVGNWLKQRRNRT